MFLSFFHISTLFGKYKRKIYFAPPTIKVLTLYTSVFQFRDIKPIKFQYSSICTSQTNWPSNVTVTMSCVVHVIHTHLLCSFYPLRKIHFASLIYGILMGGCKVSILHNWRCKEYFLLRSKWAKHVGVSQVCRLWHIYHCI